MRRLLAHEGVLLDYQLKVDSTRLDSMNSTKQVRWKERRGKGRTLELVGKDALEDFQLAPSFFLVVCG
jgi:hypothetical protein